MSLQVDIELKLKDYILNVKFRTSCKCMGILGASGSGKSMTLKAIAGIVTPEKGTILYNETVFFDSKKRINLSPQKRKVGYLFQKYALFPNMTVYQNIAVSLGKLNYEKKEKIEYILKQFQIEGLRDCYPINLSGGEQQRTALARMLIYQPSLLLFDEPFSALDAYLKDGLQIELKKLLGQYNGQAVLVSHDMDEVYKLCGELAVMSKGNILIKKETKALFAEPEKILVARMSGCKNILMAEKVDDNTVRIKDWNVTLKTKKVVNANVKAVGIRAHSFYKVSEDEFFDKTSDQNYIMIKVVKVVESLFEINLLLKTEEGENEIWWKKSIEKGGDSKFHEIKYIGVLPEDILLLE